MDGEDFIQDPEVRFDEWLRTDFIAINTALEEAYFEEREDVILGRPSLEALKTELARSGGERLEAVARMAWLPQRATEGYRLLGLVGHYLAACRRHEANLSALPDCRNAAWTLSMRLGSALGVTPRFVFAHQSLFNDALAGRFRTFTSLPDENLWIRFNSLGVLAYRRAAQALGEVPGLGVTSPIAAYLLEGARSALGDVLKFNRELGEGLSVERFFFNIRPYFKSYSVGGVELRGANAGDFSAINEIDVLLGLCRTTDPFYQSVIHEKAGHVPPGDQAAMRSLGRQPSLLHAFVVELETHGPGPEWRANAALFLEVCKAHGAAYTYHHQRLVLPFLGKPARSFASAHPAGVSSSGPPLEEVIAGLRRLLDLRTARDRPGLRTAAGELTRLRERCYG